MRGTGAIRLSRSLGNRRDDGRKRKRKRKRKRERKGSLRQNRHETSGK